MLHKMKIIELKNQPSSTSNLYRYVTIDKLLDFLIKQRLPLTRLNLFEDKLEGVTNNHLLLNITSDIIGEKSADWMADTLKQVGMNVKPKNRNSIRKQRAQFQNDNFANCWFVSEHESVAMWQLYSNLDSVAIKIPYNSFISEIHENNFKLNCNDYISLKYGKVNYYRFNNIAELGNSIINENVQGFVKDKSFEHEQEFRLILNKEKTKLSKLNRKESILDEQMDNFRQKLDLKVIYLQLLNFQQMNFEIIFHPKSQIWHRENVENIIKRYELNLKTRKSGLIDIYK